MEQKQLFATLEKTHMAMQNRQNRQNRLSLDRKRGLEKEQGYEQEVTSHSVSHSRQPIAKGHACDLAPPKEDKLASHLPGKRADASALLRNVNRTSMHNLKDKVAHLPWGTVKVKAPLKQKCVEIQLDEALDNLHNMTTERDSLAQQLRVSQGQAVSEQMYLIQRVKDLQGTVHQLEQERYGFRSRQSLKDEQVLGLESQIHTRGSKLAIAEEELKKLKTECSALSELKIKMDGAISESQLRLMAKDRELQKVLDRNKCLEERNDSLVEQVDGVGEGVSTLQSVTFQLSQDKNALQEQLERKDKTIGSLSNKVEKLETSAKSLQQEVAKVNRELDALGGKLTDTEEKLNAVEGEKTATLQANTDLRDDLDKVQLDNQALQRNVEGSSQEVEILQKKLQEYVTGSSCSKILLSSNEEVIENLKFTVKQLGLSAKSLQQEVSKRNHILVAMQKKLKDTKEKLDATLQENTDLRSDHEKAQLDNKALQLKDEGPSEVEFLRRKLQECITEISHTEILLACKEEVIEDLVLTVGELDESGKSLQEEVNRGNRELVAIQRELLNTAEKLDAVVRGKEDTIYKNTELRDDLVKAQLENQALQRKVEGSSQEVEILHKKLQEYMTESSQKNTLFSSKEEVIKNLQLRIQELEMSTKGVQQTVSERNVELETVRKKLTITENALDSVAREKEATVQANTDLRDDLDKVQLDNQALQRKVEGSSQEVELLQKKLKDCINESSCSEILLNSKKEVIEHLQGIVKELNSSAMSLQQEVNRGNRELVAIGRKLSITVENLDIVEMEKEGILQKNTDLRNDFVKAQLENQALQHKVEGSSQEVELLQKKLQDYMTESSCSKMLLSSNEEAIGSLRLKVEELETSAESLQQEVDRESRELKAMQRKLKDTEENLDSVVSEKEARLEAHTTLRDNHDKLQLDNQALQCKVEGCSQEVELLQKKLQEYVTESSRTNVLLCYKDKANEHLQLRVQELETSAKSLQQDVSKRDRKLDAIQTKRRKKLKYTKEKMDAVVRKIEATPQASTPTQNDLDKIQLENQALQCQEVEILQKKLCDFVSKMSCMNDQLSLKEDVIENLQLTVKELQMSVKGLQQEVNRGHRELEFTRKRLSNTEETMSAVMQEKDTMLKENLDLRDDLHKVQSGHQALQRKVDGSSQEVELLQLELQDFSTDVNSLQTWVSSSEGTIARLLQTFEELEPSAVSLQQEVNRGNRELDTVRRESISTNIELGALVQEEEATLQECSANR